MRSAPGKPETTLQTTEYLVHRSQRWNCRMHGDKITSQSWLRCSRNISIINTCLRTWVISRRSTGSARNHKNYSSTWTTQRSLNFARIPQNINVPIAMIFRYRVRLLQLREKFEVLADSYNTPEDQLRLYFNPWLCHREEFQSRTKTRHIWKTDHVLQGEADAEESKTRKHGSHPTILSRWNEQEAYRKSLAEHNVGEKEIMLFDRNALERHDYTATRAERLQNAKHLVLHLNADGHQKPLRQRAEFVDAVKQCLKMQDAHLAETQQSLRPIRPQHQQRQRQDQQFEGGENFDYYVDRKTEWRCYRESHGETRWQHLHLQLRSGQLHNGKRVGAHGSLHHLINGGDFGFLERIPENRRAVWTGHPLTTHICAVQSVHKRGTHITRLAQGPARLNSHGLQRHLCAPEKNLSPGSHMSHPLLLSHLPCSTSTSSSSFTLPSTTTPVHALQSGQHDLLQEHPLHHQPRIMRISRISQSTSSAMKNHSGVKTCRVTETRARQLPRKY